MHLTALWGKWNTSNIENHLGGNRCVIFDHIIQSRCLSYRGGSQPAREEHPLLPTGQWGTAAVWGDRAHQTLKTMSRGTWCVISGQILFSWYMHHMWYSQPAIEEHPITPNRPLRNGCIWHHYGASETHQTLETISGGRCVIFEHIIQTWSLLIGETPNRPVRNAHYSQPATEERRLYGAIGHIQHWEPCLGDQMCYFGTNIRLLIYPWCVILPTGQWGTHHYSQPAAEEWMHFKEI